MGRQALAWWPQSRGDLWPLLWTVGLFYRTVGLTGVVCRAAAGWGSHRQTRVYCSFDSQHRNLFLYSLYCAGKRRLIHRMKRNHIKGREGRNLYSVRQIGSALREAKKGVLNDSCLSRQFKHLLCVLFLDQIDLHFTRSVEASPRLPRPHR